MLPLSHIEVLVVDCQATAASPRGHLLELGWARVRDTLTQARTCLIKLPGHEHIPPAVERITGISERMLEQGIDADAAWRELSAQASTLADQPAPTIAHFARFEEPFLRSLAGCGCGPDRDGERDLPLDLVCTHEIARRLLPDLPRRSLRALTGYFGGAVSTLRRSADHVEATAFVWRELVRLLDAQGVSTWTALHAWLAESRAALTRPRRPRRRVWPMPRDLRLSLPDAPGIYRMQRTSGSVLYIGKASSLRHRVNSYFRHQRDVPERMLEMLSQARDLSFDIAPTALEAALLESDEIKHHRPPYNLALTESDRTLWFAARDLSERSPHPSERCPVGPFSSAETLDQFSALARAQASSDDLCVGVRAVAVDPVNDITRTPGCASIHTRLLRLGTQLWREGRRERDVDLDDLTAAQRAQIELEWLVLRAALARRRARWLTRLADASVVWSEPDVDGARLIVIENGEITVRAAIEPGAEPPIPPGHARPIRARQEGFTIARFDRLRVLTTELKRLVSDGAPVAVRFGHAPPLAGARLAAVLSWL